MRWPQAHTSMIHSLPLSLYFPHQLRLPFFYLSFHTLLPNIKHRLVWTQRITQANMQTYLCKLRLRLQKVMY